MGGSSWTNVRGERREDLRWLSVRRHKRVERSYEMQEHVERLGQTWLSDLFDYHTEHINLFKII